MNMSYNTSKLPPFSLLEEPLLTFNSEDTLLDVNPLRGIVQNGAYSSSIFPTYTPELRIATIGPVSRWKNLRTLVDTLRSKHAPTDRKQYVPEFRGFENTFNVPLVAAKISEAHIRLPDDLGALGAEGPPHIRLLNALRTGMQRLALVRDHFDVVLVHLPMIGRPHFALPVLMYTIHLRQLVQVIVFRLRLSMIGYSRLVIKHR
ncbi:Uncharacterised protein [Serratia rubidaea]|uniref:Uncharacterized protein n=1 Tax=Serratia rubidaea TaxID=61652 RepID=A0A3S4HWF0_SERRU|nr:Uncharacterised protein [Serratia rubidaea]